MSTPENESSWNSYYQQVAQRPPRPLLIDAAARFAVPGLAVDLGCGGGIETRELLRSGWRVHAIDQEPTAFDALAADIPADARERLTTQRAAFADMTLPPADLIWAGLSLPFCPPAQFPALWAAITAALQPGGRLACDLFGIHHAWRDRPEITFLTLNQVSSYLYDWEVELLRESEEERPTAFQGMQHWHGFDVIARKR